jgi:hypothetical protein
VRLPARGVLFDVRGADTVRVELEIDDAVATSIRLRRPEVVDDGRLFVQMKGRATLTGRLGGTVLDARGQGFFETWR